MTLSTRLAARDAVRAMDGTVGSGLAVEDSGSRTMEAEFFTGHRMVRATFSTSESRISDYLNSSALVLELRPLYSIAPYTGTEVELSGGLGRMPKSQLLFVLPVREPAPLPPEENTAWRVSHAHRCWIGLGPYTVLGSLRTEARDDRERVLRQLQRQFIVLTEACLTLPGGAERQVQTVVANQHAADVLAMVE